MQRLQRSFGVTGGGTERCRLMLGGGEAKRERIGSAAAVAALHALLAYFVLAGVGAVPLIDPPSAIQLFDAKEPPPPPPPKPSRPDIERKPRKARPKNAEGSASPANLHDTPTEIVAPKPLIPLPPPPPLPAAPVAGQGNEAAAGAAAVPGPGTGAGGIGNGVGSGLSGNGTGGGGVASHVRWVKGRIDGRDYPRSAVEARSQGITYVRFTVGRDGRIKDCAVTRSSGHRELDDVTCRLILRRFRYVPARDAEGRPVEEVVRGQQDWDLGPERPEVEVDAEPER